MKKKNNIEIDKFTEIMDLRSMLRIFEDRIEVVFKLDPKTVDKLRKSTRSIEEILFIKVSKEMEEKIDKLRSNTIKVNKKTGKVTFDNVTLS